jgi:hypothetical protein
MHQNYMSGRKTHRTELGASSSEFINLRCIFYWRSGCSSLYLIIYVCFIQRMRTFVSLLVGENALGKDMGRLATESATAQRQRVVGYS